MSNTKDVSPENCIKKYIAAKGHLGFDEVGFQLMDNIVLCQLSYIDFARVLSRGDAVTLREAARRFHEIGHCDLKIVWGADGGFDFLDPVADSKRFENVVIKNFEDFHDLHFEMQFCAMTFVLDRTEEYIVFRGADETIVGWKECFMLAYGDMPSHKYALRYLNNHIKSGKKYYVGGHSKGGNLALYGASKIGKEKLELVERVFTNDSPGFLPEADEIDVEKLQDKWFCIRPDDSIVGRIFEMQAKHDIITKCNVSGLKQHYLQTWMFEGMEPMVVPKFSVASDRAIGALNLWLNRQSFDDRMEKIDDIYAAMTKEGADTMEDFFQEGAHGYERVLRLYRKTLGIAIGGMISSMGALILIFRLIPGRDRNKSKDIEEAK